MARFAMPGSHPRDYNLIGVAWERFLKSDVHPRLTSTVLCSAFKKFKDLVKEIKYISWFIVHKIG